mmetsp:Transcript_29857/g.74693  ORF Transcript_29857/g.74693 Transcript_29857/m.74693 type:complete len:470 (+) Transcript_29857:671-2080(+)
MAALASLAMDATRLPEGAAVGAVGRAVLAAVEREAVAAVADAGDSLEAPVFAADAADLAALLPPDAAAVPTAFTCAAAAVATAVAAAAVAAAALTDRACPPPTPPLPPAVIFPPCAITVAALWLVLTPPPLPLLPPPPPALPPPPPPMPWLSIHAATITATKPTDHKTGPSSVPPISPTLYAPVIAFSEANSFTDNKVLTPSGDSTSIDSVSCVWPTPLPPPAAAEAPPRALSVRQIMVICLEAPGGSLMGLHGCTVYPCAPSPPHSAVPTNGVPISTVSEPLLKTWTVCVMASRPTLSPRAGSRKATSETTEDPRCFLATKTLTDSPEPRSVAHSRVVKLFRTQRWAAYSRTSPGANVRVPSDTLCEGPRHTVLPPSSSPCCAVACLRCLVVPSAGAAAVPARAFDLAADTATPALFLDHRLPLLSGKCAAGVNSPPSRVNPVTPGLEYSLARCALAAAKVAALVSKL